MHHEVADSTHSNDSGIREQLQLECEEMAQKHHGYRPHLVVIQVGAREDSTIYVRMKNQAANKVCVLPFTAAELSLLTGFLVQTPTQGWNAIHTKEPTRNYQAI